MRKKERYEKILAWFRENVPVAETELHYENPFELLLSISVISLDVIFNSFANSCTLIFAI